MISKWKANLVKICFFSGVLIFFIAIAAFVLDAMTIQNVTIAWILFAFILLGLLLIIAGIVTFLVFYKEKIKDYFKNIANR